MADSKDNTAEPSGTIHGTTPNDDAAPVDDSAAQTDPITADTQTDEVSEQIPEPEAETEKSEQSKEDAHTAPESEPEVEVQAETPDTLDADVAEQAADTSSDNQDVVIPSDSEESLDSIPEIASPATPARNDEKESADPSATPQDDKKEPEQTETTEPTSDQTPADNSDDSGQSDVSAEALAEADSPIAPANDNPNAKWYVVHTFSGHENKVATNLKQRIDSEHLENRIIDILVPTQDKIEIRGGKKEQVKEKIFPGYILVKMDLDDASWLAVRTTQGVTAFVGMNNKPTPISEREVQSIVKFMTQGAPATFKDVFMVDDTVKIIDGPFTDFIGKVESVDKEKGKVRVLVSIFGRETPVELDFLQVTKL